MCGRLSRPPFLLHALVMLLTRRQGICHKISSDSVSKSEGKGQEVRVEKDKERKKPTVESRQEQITIKENLCHSTPIFKTTKANQQRTISPNRLPSDEADNCLRIEFVQAVHTSIVLFLS